MSKGKQSDWITALSISQARMKVAADLLRWSLANETHEITPHNEVLEVVARIEGWSDAIWKAIRDGEGPRR